MRTGRPIAEVAAELQRQANTRRDFIAPTARLRTAVVDGEVMLDGLPETGPLALTDLAHTQIGADLAIPKPYYDRMRTEAPALLARNVEHWLHATPQDRMLRTLDGRVRSVLSAKYRPLDNIDLLAAVVPAFQDLDGIQVMSTEVTERRLYIKAVLPTVGWDLAMARRDAMVAAGIELHRERPGEDAVQAAVTIGNSEVGEGQLYVEEGLYRLSCYNLATIGKTIRKYHVGRKHKRNGNGDGDAPDDSAWELLSDEARQADDRAFWLRVRDVVKAAFRRERFEANVRKFAGASADIIPGSVKVEKVVEVTANRYGLTEGTRESILRHLIEGGDLTRFGLVNAVTRASQDEKDYDTATDLERLGGKLIELPKGEWEVLTS